MQDAELLKRRSVSTRLHGATSVKRINTNCRVAETSVSFYQTTRRNIPKDSQFILVAVRTWNLTLYLSFMYVCKQLMYWQKMVSARIAVACCVFVHLSTGDSCRSVRKQGSIISVNAVWVPARLPGRNESEVETNWNKSERGTDALNWQNSIM
jgi:hypothetical protein